MNVENTRLVALELHVGIDADDIVGVVVDGRGASERIFRKNAVSLVGIVLNVGGVVITGDVSCLQQFADYLFVGDGILAVVIKFLKTNHIGIFVFQKIKNLGLGVALALDPIITVEQANIETHKRKRRIIVVKIINIMQRIELHGAVDELVARTNDGKHYECRIFFQEGKEQHIQHVDYKHKGVSHSRKTRKGEFVGIDIRRAVTQHRSNYQADSECKVNLAEKLHHTLPK